MSADLKAPRALLTEGQSALADGRLDIAAAIDDQLRRDYPPFVETWIFAGLLANRQGHGDSAIAFFRAGCDRVPSHPDPWRHLGNALAAQGREIEAEAAYRDGLSQAPGNAALLNNLGALLRRGGRAREAAVELRKAVAAKPGHVGAWFNLANTLIDFGKMGDAAAALEKATALRPDDRSMRLRLAQVYHTLVRLPDAERLFESLVVEEPGNVAARRGLRAVRGKEVPRWHFPMMNDTPRNAAYRQAIARAARGDAIVLDIGTGAGLLSMCAGRESFAKVYSCEMVAPIAAAAADIMARNGLGHRVAIIRKRSNDLIVGKDLPSRADVIVTETFDSMLLGEHILSTMDHARQHLLVPGGRVIPAAASAIIALLGSDAIGQQMFVGEALGFDLSEFNRFSPLKSALNLDLYPYRLLSADREVLRFDFPGDAYIDAGKSEIVLEATENGVAIGVAQWIKLYLDDETIFENRPGLHDTPSGWLHVIHNFQAPRPIAKGETLRLLIEHNRTSIDVELLDPV